MESVTLPALPSWRVRLCIIVGFFAVTFLVFGSALQNDFVLWDDTYLIYANPIIKEISWKTVKEAFTTYDPELYIPLTILSYQVDYLIGGLHPLMFHLTNILLHTVNALLVAWVIYLLYVPPSPPVETSTYSSLRNRGWVALFAGLVFAVHPLHTEAVAWASARKDLLSTFWFLISFVSFLSYRERGGAKLYTASVSAFALALLSKVGVVTLPVILLLLDLRDHRRWSRRAIAEKIPFFLLAIVFGVVAVFGKRDIVASISPLLQTLIAGKSTLFYLQKFFLPTGLSALYPYDGLTVGLPPGLLLPTLASMFIFLTAIALMRQRRDLAFAVLWYLITLVPTFTNFFKGNEIYIASDRYAYIPSIGILLFLLPLWDVLQRRIGTSLRSRPARIAAPVAALILLSFVSVRQTQVWRDSLSLFEQAIRLSPRAIAAHINLSVIHREMGDLDGAMRYIESAEAIKKTMHTHVSRAAVYMKQKKWEEAIEENRKAMLMDPRDPTPLYGTALAYAGMGRPADAEHWYQQTIALEPRHLGARNNLAALFLERGERAQAKDMYRAALSIDGTFTVALFNLGLLEEEDGNIDEAISLFERAAALEPRAPLEILEHLLDLYARKNDIERSAETARRIINVSPGHPTATKFLEALRERGMIK